MLTRFARNATFPVPGTRITLVVKLGRKIPGVRVTQLLHAVQDVVAREVEERSRGSQPARLPFTAMAEDAVEMQVYDSGELPGGMTWEQMQGAIRGLYIYLVGGEHFFACHFDIFFARTQQVFIHVGWGNIVQATEPVIDLPGNASRAATIRYHSTRLLASPSVNISESNLLRLDMPNSSLAKSSS